MGKQQRRLKRGLRNKEPETFRMWLSPTDAPGIMRGWSLYPVHINGSTRVYGPGEFTFEEPIYSVERL